MQPILAQVDPTPAESLPAPTLEAPLEPAAATATETVSEGSATIFDIVTTIFAKGDALAQPGRMVEALQNMSIVSATVFLIVGLLCLFNGYRYYRIATVLLALAIGAFVGYALGERIGAQWIVAGCFGVLLATICFPLMKYAVALMGGLTGAYIGANGWSCIAQLVSSRTDGLNIADHYWIGAIVGLTLFGMLAFVLFKLSIIVFTSIGGSTIAVLGILALLLQIPLFSDDIASGLRAHASVIPLLVLVPAVIGLVLQETTGGEEAQAA
ncbi:MAG: hypothetical protein CMJ18_13470 [Phycisphaeraceae bacterium]|nr:hypothetical protein [Phycisphaeraceae bacterium]